MKKRHTQSILLAVLLLSVMGLGLLDTATAQEDEDMETFWAADSLHLKVDLALPKLSDPNKVLAETAKPGWTIWADPLWADMYSHDMVCLPDIDGSGVDACLTVGYEGQGGIKVKGMCMDEPGFVEGEPIANSWYCGVDWVGPRVGDILLFLTGLPAGEYELISYHNHWEQCPESRCWDCDCGMPPMPSVTANPLPAEPPEWYRDWPLPPGTGGGVTPVTDAYDVSATHVLTDDQVATSLIGFRTDGSEVLVIYEAPDFGYPDCGRPGREGGRGILNAFELVQIPCPCLGDIRDTSGFGPPDGKVDIGDLNALLMEMIRQYRAPLFELVPLPPGFECMDISDTGGFGPPDGRVDIGDLNAILIAMDGIGPASYPPYYETPCLNDAH